MCSSDLDDDFIRSCAKTLSGVMNGSDPSSRRNGKSTCLNDSGYYLRFDTTSASRGVNIDQDDLFRSLGIADHRLRDRISHIDKIGKARPLYKSFPSEKKLRDQAFYLHTSPSTTFLNIRNPSP